MVLVAPMWRRRASSILRRLAGEREVGRRLRGAAGVLVGSPYVAGALVGGPDREEELIVDLARFDCVTFVESVLALARSRSAAGFTRELVALRYRGGQISWRSRLHYFSDWLRANHHRGAVRLRTAGTGARAIETRLAVVDGLRSRRARLWVVPKRSLAHADARIVDGSVVAFASVRARLDYFHVGLLFREAGELTLFHASQSHGRVVAVPLTEFLRTNRMRGLTFAAPRGGMG